MPEIIPNWHPILVHFTFALLFLSPFAFLIAQFGKDQPWGKTFLIAGRVSLWTGVLITPLTLWAGFGAMEQAHHQISSQVDHYIHDHRNWAIATAASFALLALWAAINWRRGAKEGWLFVILALLALTPLTTTGYKGGELVYRHGVGVMSSSESSGKAHADDSESSDQEGTETNTNSDDGHEDHTH
ncbi:MAG: DUF2231 domain-containing protein [Alphaproteobacteria bacterium]|nr:DUF2231 domain-containing protein [Alphaproteobacteria bacterium]